VGEEEFQRVLVERQLHPTADLSAVLHAHGLRYGERVDPDGEQVWHEL
jgi:hypothetical protein